MTPHGVGKFNTVADSRSGPPTPRASHQVPTCPCLDQWLPKWPVMHTAAASSAAAACITRCLSNRCPRLPKFTRPQWVNKCLNYNSIHTVWPTGSERKYQTIGKELCSQYQTYPMQVEASGECGYSGFDHTFSWLTQVWQGAMHHSVIAASIVV